MKNIIFRCIFLFAVLLASCNVFSCEIIEMNERKTLQEEMSGRHEGRAETYETLELMYRLVEFFNNYYQQNGAYPAISEWVPLVSNSLEGVGLSDDGVSILDGYGSPVVYIQKSENEIKFFSVNLFEGNEENKTSKPIVYLLKFGKLQS